MKASNVPYATGFGVGAVLEAIYLILQLESVYMLRTDTLSENRIEPMCLWTWNKKLALCA